VELGLKWSSELGGSTIWDDEEMKIFYEDLPDLRAKVPAQLLPREEGAATPAPAADPAAPAEPGTAAVVGEGGEEAAAAVEGESGTEEIKPTVAAAAKEKDTEKDKAASDAKEDAAAGAQHGQKIEAIMARLPG